MNTFGNRMKILRLGLGLSQSELAAKFKKTKSAVSSYESRGRFPDEKLLKELALFFNVSTDYLLGVSETKIPISEETKGFAQKLIKQLIDENMIDDINNIPSNITDMIISALRADMAKKKQTR